MCLKHIDMFRTQCPAQRQQGGDFEGAKRLFTIGAG